MIIQAFIYATIFQILALQPHARIMGRAQGMAMVATLVTVLQLNTSELIALLVTSFCCPITNNTIHDLINKIVCKIYI